MHQRVFGTVRDPLSKRVQRPAMVYIATNTLTDLGHKSHA